jgi:hypothetical protein
LAVAQFELALETGSPQVVGMKACRKRRALGLVVALPLAGALQKATIATRLPRPWNMACRTSALPSHLTIISMWKPNSLRLRNNQTGVFVIEYVEYST